MTERVLLLDLDTPCFAAAAVVEKRSVRVTHIPTQQQKIFKTRTAFKERLKEKGIPERLSEYVFEDIQEPEPVENAFHILNQMVAGIQKKTETDRALFFLSGKDNFRDNLELPTKYKSNRETVMRPVLLKDVRSYARARFKPEICDGDEADDRIIYRGYELLEQGCYPVVSTIDKDAKAYSNIHLYNQDKPENGVIVLPGLGGLEVDAKNKVRGEGFLWYCLQMLTGDYTDGYKPTELCKVKYGEKSAYKALSTCKTEQEALQAVIKQYKEWYPTPVTYTAWNGQEYTKDWFEVMQLYHRCVRMKEQENDPLDLGEFCKRFDVEVPK